MFDHLSIGVTDLARSGAFYDAVLHPLGWVRLDAGRRHVVYGPPDHPTEPPFAILQVQSDQSPLTADFHLAFAARDRASVARFHAAGVAAGGVDDGPPGIRENYNPGYYAAFLRDPDGHRLEAVLHESTVEADPLRPVNGSCVCGEVAFVIHTPVRFFQYCHCSRCRKRSGSVHAANLAIPAAQLAWTRGEESVATFQLQGAKGWGNAFCRRCGSGLPWRTRSGSAWIVPAGALDDDPVLRPTRRIHHASRASWSLEAAGLPTFDGEPD